MSAQVTVTPRDMMYPDAAFARRALPLLDLTDLTEACTEGAVAALCAKARASSCAAVCVWPRFVAQARQELSGSDVRIATVINFPKGGDDVALAFEGTAEALRDGADEIDLVLPYAAFLRGETAPARTMIEAVRGLCDGGRLLKVILETGELVTPDAIAGASRLALEAGADFLKTSTGKSPVSATPEAARAMLGIIHAHRGARPAGIKISGGLRSIRDAAPYLALADEIMGPGWAGPATFRFGASSLHADLVAALGEGA